MIGTLLLLGIICAALSYLYYITQRGARLPPGPPCYPFIGNINQMDTENGLIYFRDLRKKYGNIFCLMVGNMPVIVVNGIKSCREMFIGKADFTSDRFIFGATYIISKGHGIVGTNGHHWKEQRTFALTTLRKFGYGKASLEGPISQEIDIFLSKIEKMDEKPFDLHDYILVSISNTICSLLFGKRFDHEDKMFLKFVHVVYESFKVIGLGNILNYFPIVRHLPGDMFKVKELIKEQEHLTVYIEQLIREHRETLDENNERDYMDSFLIAQQRKRGDETSTFTDRQLIETVRDFFFAGTDTTSTGILWGTLFLATHPNVQDKVWDEIDRVIGMNRRPTMNDKENMPYLEAVLLEIQRLGNVSPLALPHAAKEEFEFNGYRIPKNAVILPNLDSLTRDPEVFPDPLKFKPERFLDDKLNVVGKDKFAPFSMGRRICVGESLAKMEMYLFLVSMVQRFEFFIDGAIPSFDGDFGLTTTPASFKVRAVKRSDS